MKFSFQAKTDHFFADNDNFSRLVQQAMQTIKKIRPRKKRRTRTK